MTASESLSDRSTAPGHCCPPTPAADPWGHDDETEWRRARYAWLYDDEDIWASPSPGDSVPR